MTTKLQPEVSLSVLADAICIALTKLFDGKLSFLTRRAAHAGHSEIGIVGGKEILGAGVCLYHDRLSDRVEASGVWPRHNSDHFKPNTFLAKGRTPGVDSITFSRHRNAESIAADIKRKLVDAYLPLYAQEWKRCQEWKDTERNADALRERAAAIFGDETRIFRDAFYTPAEGTFTITKTGHGKIELSFNDLDEIEAGLPHVLALCKAVADYRARK